MKKAKAILFCAIGFGLLLTSGIFTFNKIKFIRTAMTSVGVVITTPYGGSHPEIEFRTQTGEKIKYPQGGFISGYHVGDHVDVLYQPKEPKLGACVNKFGALWFFPVFMGVLGILFGISGIALMNNSKFLD